MKNILALLILFTYPENSISQSLTARNGISVSYANLSDQDSGLSSGEKMQLNIYRRSRPSKNLSIIADLGISKIIFTNRKSKFIGANNMVFGSFETVSIDKLSITSSLRIRYDIINSPEIYLTIGLGPKFNIRDNSFWEFEKDACEDLVSDDICDDLSINNNGLLKYVLNNTNSDLTFQVIGAGIQLDNMLIEAMFEFDENEYEFKTANTFGILFKVAYEF